jgi:hypothetical protein
MNNTFNRLSSGQDWLENAYKTEDTENQARLYARDQVKAIQTQASDLLRQKIGDDAVEAAVGVGAIAYPYLKGYLGMNQGTSGVADSVSDAVGNVSNRVRQGVRGAVERVQTAREQARQAVQKVSQQAEELQGQAKQVADRALEFDPAAAVPEETQTSLLKTQSRLDQLDTLPSRVAGDLPSRVAGDLPSRVAGDLPTVSVPKGAFAERSLKRQALREQAEKEFGTDAPDGSLKAIPSEPTPDEPGVYDPFSLKPREVIEPTGGFEGVAGTPEVAEGGDIYDDLASQSRMAAERFNLPTIEDLKKADAVKQAQQEAQRVQTTQPAAEPIPEEPDEIKPYVPPSEQTGGIDPSTLPEGAGARGAGGQAIPAQRPAAEPIQQRGLQQQAFEQDPEEDIRTGEKLEDIPSSEELFKPIQITAEPDKPEEEDLPEGFGEAEEAPSLEEQEKKVEPEEEPEGFGKDLAKTGEDIGKDVGEDVGEDIGEEAAAAAVPGVGELAIAAIGVGQLISGLIDQHKQNESEQSEAAAQMNQAKPSVALDPSNAFDSTFR